MKYLISDEENNQLDQKLDLIISLLSNNPASSNSNEIIGGKWVPEKKAQEITGKKGTTLWKMRNAGKLTFTKLNNRVYYDLESILSLLEKNKQEAYK